MKTDKVECGKDERKQENVYPVSSGIKVNGV